MIKMDELTLGLCQINVIDDKNTNLKTAEKFLNNAHEKNVELAVLPEMFNCPYENKKFIEYGEEEENSLTLNTIKNIATDYNIHIIAGSIPEKVENNIFNTCFFFNNKGKIIGKYSKMHLFDVDVKEGIKFKESDTLTAGNKFTLVETKWGKIGLGICYDLRFPEFSRLLTLKGADILIYPGAFNLTTGPSHWETLLKSRALDNQVYSVGVAPALNKNSSYHSYGHSLICSPWGNIINKAEYDEKLIVEKIDLSLISKIRSEIPVLKNRRTDMYCIK